MEECFSLGSGVGGSSRTPSNETTCETLHAWHVPDPHVVAARKEKRLSQNWGYLFAGPYKKDYSTLGSILGSPYFGKLSTKLQSLSLANRH